MKLENCSAGDLNSFPTCKQLKIDSFFLYIARMDKDGSLNISFNEWRDFMLLAPSTDIHDLIKFWRHSTVSRGASVPISLYGIVCNLIDLSITLLWPEVCTDVCLCLACKRSLCKLANCFSYSQTITAICTLLRSFVYIV